MSTDLTVHDARVLTARIRESVAGVWDLIVEAYTSRAWTSLGYDSWDDYTRTEFDGVRIALPREDRREVIGSLRDAGLSTRAIASAIGVNDKTVRNDLAGAEYSAPARSFRTVLSLTPMADAMARVLNPASRRLPITSRRSSRGSAIRTPSNSVRV